LGFQAITSRSSLTEIVIACDTRPALELNSL
jgi:hypothetical protein